GGVELVRGVRRVARVQLRLGVGVVVSPTTGVARLIGQITVAITLAGLVAVVAQGASGHGTLAVATTVEVAIPVTIPVAIAIPTQVTIPASSLGVAEVTIDHGDDTLLGLCIEMGGLAVGHQRRLGGVGVVVHDVVVDVVASVIRLAIMVPVIAETV
ncbi:hypothetical protein, partial [Escherichia coli]|uniref:hypothetical protein n=1 Tax=Escherichia coli TaxID=562 RepID=UPI0013206568